MESTTIRSTSHPRRPPAHRSVSLRHASASPPTDQRMSSSVKQQSVSLDNATSSDSSTSLKPLIGKDDSGESSNADKWFEKSNNNAPGNRPGFADHSPPFFLQNSSSGETQNEMHPHGQRPGEDRPIFNHSLHFGAENSSTEDFRSVIDDLTIENKKLRRKLKAYEKAQDPHMKDEKLFEVRVHGLPSHKKKELEETLRKFAMGLNAQTGHESVSNIAGTISSGLVSKKSGSSQASHLHTDSAYASASASGPASSAAGQKPPSHHAGPGRGSSAQEKSRQNIQTYLHDIPEHLLPCRPPVMTDKAKGKMVVRRLEQIFAGKGATVGMHQHPEQQQEVSDIAAKVDKSELEHSGLQPAAEGIREARILPNNDEQVQDPDGTDAFATTIESSDLPNDQIASHDFARKNAEQRPTRPLDLDPERAQVPSDNFFYMRRLGFSPPKAGSLTPPQDGHGWIYLNLLINMAQLHTISVTPDFVRKAIADRSQKLEISEDGRKVRWKGGANITRTSSEGDSTPEYVAGMPLQRANSSKRIKLSDYQSSSAANSSRKAGKTNTKPSQSKVLAYTPLFHHRSSSDDMAESESEEDNTTEFFPLMHPDPSSAMTSSVNPDLPMKRNRKQETGPIIFYNNANFCTDLSGDSKSEETMRYNPCLYHTISKSPIGVAQVRTEIDSAPSETKGPLDETDVLPEPMDLDDNPISEDLELSFPSISPLSSHHGKTQKMHPLEVSGIGGVCPADNFAINVESRHAQLDNTSAPSTTYHAVPARYPDRIASVLRANADGRVARTAFHKQVLSTEHKILPPSQLPDASCFMPADGEISPVTDESDIYDEDGDDLATAHGSSNLIPPSTAKQPIDMDFASDSSDDASVSESDDDEDEDEDLDFLATARELDPEAIRKRELEYDANMAERLAEEIPAGSSAATAGGGSGFNSPVSVRGNTGEEIRGVKRRRSQIGTAPAGLQKAESGDSMDTNGVGDSGEE